MLFHSIPSIATSYILPHGAMHSTDLDTASLSICLYVMIRVYNNGLTFFHCLVDPLSSTNTSVLETVQSKATENYY